MADKILISNPIKPLGAESDPLPEGRDNVGEKHNKGANAKIEVSSPVAPLKNYPEYNPQSFDSGSKEKPFKQPTMNEMTNGIKSIS